MKDQKGICSMAISPNSSVWDSMSFCHKLFRSWSLKNKSKIKICEFREIKIELDKTQPKPCLFHWPGGWRSAASVLPINSYLYYGLSRGFFFFGIFRAEPAAYGSPQARGRIWAVVTSLCHSTATAMPGPCCICNLHHSSWQRQIVKPLSETKDRTCVLMDASQICFLSHDRNSYHGLFESSWALHLQ